LKYGSSIVLEHIVPEFESASFDLDAILAYKLYVLEMIFIPFVLEIKCPSVGIYVILFLNGMPFDLGLQSMKSNDIEPTLITFRP
jgi:hypothetical protein